MPGLLRSIASTCLLAASLAIVAAPSFAQALPGGLAAVTSVEGVDEYRLPNGLQLLLIPDDSKPTTTVNLTYRVGSRHENYGETGMAHLLEHMLFKGTPKHPRAWDEFQKRGLAANGSTWFDRTNYTASFAANEASLEWYIGWLADSMINSFVARKDLDTEMTVVRNEMESGENNPARILLQKTMALMFDWHNYGQSTIGARADVENVDIPRLQAFYRLYYQPDNATLTIAGKFDTAGVLRTVAATLGAIPKPTRQLPALYTLDPVQDGERSVTLRRVGGTPAIQAGYHIPAGPSRDYAATELLSVILADTPSGRLHKRLTQQQLASGVSSYGFALHDPGAMFFGAQLAPGQDVEKARAELLATVESIRREPITADELARAKLKWLKDWDQSFTNPETVGHAMSESISQGDWRLFFLTRDRVRDAQLADVQRVAEQYLLPANRTLGIYLPSDSPQRAPALGRADLAKEMSEFKPQAAAAKVEAFEATPANIDARTQTGAIGGIKTALLAKGTRGNAVTAVLMLHFGDEKSLAGQNATAQAVAALLDKGTKTLSRQQVQDRLDALKTELAVSASPGRVVVTLQSRRDTLPAAIALVGDLLRNPTFPADVFDEFKRSVQTGIEQQRKEPGAVLRNTLDRLGNPYPRGDVRYKPSFDELADDYRSLTLERVRAFHGRFYGAAHGEFSAVGDMDAAAVRAALQTAFAGWGPGAAFTRVPEPLFAVKPDRLLLATPDKPNANMLVRLALPLNDLDADYPALTVANYLLGSGGSARLWKRIRESEGLSYDVRSQVDWNNIDRNSMWQASAIFAPQNRAKVEAAFREEVARAVKDGFTAQELAEGKASLLNYRQLSRSQDASVAYALANNLYLGRTFELAAKIDAAIAALTLEQVNAALRKYVTPDNFVAAFAGDFKP
ncbi:MAG TPA: pitrilysin family protein [Burkholderiaceae bacterium]